MEKTAETVSRVKFLDPLRMTREEIVKSAIFFQGAPENSKSNAQVGCFLLWDGKRYEGAILEIKYSRAKGYYWETIPFNTATSARAIDQALPLTRNFQLALQDAGMSTCPCCDAPLFKDGTIHNPQECATIESRLSYLIYRIFDGIRIFLTRLKSKFNLQ
jgi:hypothetical protein